MNNHERNNAELTPGALVNCPACGLPADVAGRFSLGGAPGPVEHVKVVCVQRHRYTLPVDMFPVNAAEAEHISASGVSR
jgi:hypothetical protein